MGEFRTNDCGTCAAACVASYHTVSNTLGSARYELLEGVDAMQLADQVALNRTLRTRECPMCTEWVFCPPYASVNFREHNETSSCRLNWRVLSNGSSSPEPYHGIWEDTCNLPSFEGCETELGRVIPAGTCTLKYVNDASFDEHFENPQQDGDIKQRTNGGLVSGACNWTPGIGLGDLIDLRHERLCD